jgi:glucose-6-phosphate 1-dehydrogenase
MKTSLVIFGIAGDLGRRKLLPSLFNLVKSGFGEDLEIIGVSRRKIDKLKLLDRFDDEKFSDVSKFADIFRIVQINPENNDDFHKLKFSKNTRPIFYLSVPPDASGRIVEGLGAAGLNTDKARIMFEKPFGHDTASATKLLDSNNIFDESQIFRIDHYLEKDMAQNLVVFRGSNAIFSHIWHNRYIEKIDIIASEKIGIEGRSNFYEQTGAMRDFIQGHLLQLAALVLMKIPLDFSWDQLSEYRLAALQKLEPAGGSGALIRGQYDGYLAEADREKSDVETYASLTVNSTDPKWRGVPIRLVTGKKLAEKFTEIRVYFKKSYPTQDNLFKIRLDNNSLDIGLKTKIVGYDREFETINAPFAVSSEPPPEAYEQVIIDAIRGDRSLFLSRQEVLESWRIIDAAFQHRVKLRKYKPGVTFDEVV